MKTLKLIDKNGVVLREVPANVMESPEELRKILKDSGCSIDKKPKWRLTFEQATCFSEVASSLYHEHLKANLLNVKVGFISPYIVNITFAMELYLKSIHQKLDTKAYKDVSYKHNLKNLYFSLPGKTQNDLKQSLQSCLVASNRPFDDIDLDSKIRSIANEYTEWRYIHENEFKRFGALGDYIPLLSALYNSSLDIKWYEQKA